MLIGGNGCRFRCTTLKNQQTRVAKGIIELLVIEVITATPAAIDNKLIYCTTRMTYSTEPILKICSL